MCPPSFGGRRSRDTKRTRTRTTCTQELLCKKIIKTQARKLRHRTGVHAHAREAGQAPFKASGSEYLCSQCLTRWIALPARVNRLTTAAITATLSPPCTGSSGELGSELVLRRLVTHHLTENPHTRERMTEKTQTPSHTHRCTCTCRTVGAAPRGKGPGLVTGARTRAAPALGGPPTSPAAALW